MNGALDDKKKYFKLKSEVIHSTHETQYREGIIESNAHQY